MTHPAVNEALMALRKRYAAGLPAKVSKAAEHVESLLASPADAARGQSAHRSLHSLIGSLGTYGFYDLSQVARSAETLLRGSLESGRPLSPEERRRLLDAIARLGFLAGEAAGDATSGPT